MDLVGLRGEVWVVSGATDRWKIYVKWIRSERVMSETVLQQDDKEDAWHSLY